MTEPRSSLRERSKAKRRSAIQRAAMRLFAERGYEGATIAEIADAAEVAPRTVAMYFPTKLDIALSTSSDIADRLTATFHAHPGLPFTDIVDRWLVGEATTMDAELTAMTAAMFEANPDLRAVSATRFTDAARIGQQALLAQLGLAPEDPLAPIASAAVSAAITGYIGTVLASGASAAVHQPFMRYLRAIIAAASTS